MNDSQSNPETSAETGQQSTQNPARKAANQPSNKTAGNAASLGQPIMTFFRFLYYVFTRFHQDHCQQRAASLTFTSLLATVPLLAVSFAIFAAFPAYSRLKDKVQSFVFENFVPQVGSSIQDHLSEFTKQTGELTAVGILFLVFTSVMLLVSISNTMDYIWRARRRRNIVSRLLVNWAVITIAPILFGASMSISSVLFAYAQESGVEAFTGPLTRLTFALPFILQAFGFTALFVILPNTPVRRTDAAIGGLVASFLFELLKRGFGLYVAHFPTYQTIYGALATIPIFLMWMYLSWMVLLASAEMTAALPEWRGGTRRVRKTGLAPLDRLVYALAVLSALKQEQVNGGGLRQYRLLRAAGIGPDALADVAERLEKNRYISRGYKGEWLLVRDLTEVTLYDLFNHLGLGIEAGIPPRQLRKAWTHRFAKVRTGMTEAMQDRMGMTLAELLRAAEPGEDIANDTDESNFSPTDEEVEQDQSSRRARILALLGIGALTAGGS